MSHLKLTDIYGGGEYVYKGGDSLWKMFCGQEGRKSLVLLEFFFHMNICFVHSTKTIVLYRSCPREYFPEWIPALNYQP